MNSPDMLAGLLFIAAFLSLISGRRNYEYLSVLLFSLLVLTRPENIVLPVVFCALGLMLTTKRFSTPFLLVLLSACGLSYLVLILTVDTYSWALLYKHSFFGYIPDLQNAPPRLTVWEYLTGLKFIFRTAFYSDFALILLITIVTVIKTAGHNRIVFAGSLSLLLSLIIRIILFPDLSTRFFTGPFVIAFILFFSMMFPRESSETDLDPRF